MIVEAVVSPSASTVVNLISVSRLFGRLFVTVGIKKLSKYFLRVFK